MVNYPEEPVVSRRRHDRKRTGPFQVPPEEPPTVPRETRRRALTGPPTSRTVLLVNDSRPPAQPARRAFDSGEIATIKQPPKSRRVAHAGEGFWPMILAAFVAGLVVGVAFMPALRAHVNLARAIGAPHEQPARVSGSAKP